jgi:glycosyltransferase involved in cell wall biosynthesis
VLKQGTGLALPNLELDNAGSFGASSGGPGNTIADGNDDFVAPLDTASVLARLVQELHLNESLNRAMGRRARVTIERRFSEEATEQAFLNVWDRLVHVKSRPRCAE